MRMRRRSTRRIPDLLAAITTITVLSVALLVPLDAGASPASPSDVTTRSGAYLGAYVQPSSWSDTAQRSAVTNLEADLGRTLDIDHYYYLWGHPFPSSRDTWDVANGRIPMISWGRTNLSAFMNGSQDAMVTQRARGLRDFGSRVLLRWFFEMDDWVGVDIESPAQFVAAWRRMHDIFTTQGATNVEWVWCPNSYTFGNGVADQFYPGDRYVDWICADGYNWSPARANSPWRSFRDVFASFYTWAAPKGKPLMIGETGVMERNPGDKAAWITNMATTIETTYPRIKALVYFDANSTANFGGMYDWRVDTSTSSYDAFEALARDPYFGGAEPDDPTVDTQAPTAPRDLTLTASGSSRVDLTWSASSDDVGVQGYEVVRDGAVVATVSSTNYVDMTVSPMATYTYSLRARDAAGNVSGGCVPASVTVHSQQTVPFADGFEGGSMSSWSGSSQTTVRTGDAHGGSWAAEAVSNRTGRGFASRNLASARSELFVRTWFKVLSQSSTMNLLRLQTTTGANILTLFVSSGGDLMVRNDVRATNTWSPTKVAKAAWHEVQIRVKVAGASSLTEVWYDGQRIGRLSTAHNLGTSPIRRLVIGDDVARRSHQVLYDDVVVSTAAITSG